MNEQNAYRPNVGAIFLNSQNQILVLERINHPGAWQFPQGGVDKGESYVEALKREVLEEISVEPEQYRILESCGYYRYEFPEAIRDKHLPFVGQQQVYFLCKANHDFFVHLETDEPEFSKHKWISVEEFQLNWAPKFKRSVFKKVFLDFFRIKI